MVKKNNVLLAGIGGASLGTELFKCLRYSNNYNIYGCDISKFAYGHYQNGFIKTYLIDRSNYIDEIIKICLKEKIWYVIPGGEEPVIILDKARKELLNNGIKLVANSSEIIQNFTNKQKTFEILSKLGLKIPLTKFIRDPKELDDMIFPCIIKPSKGSGGSVFVFLANDREEAEIYIHYLLKNHLDVIVQEYLHHNEGEFTIGLLSKPTKEIVGSIVLKRQFDAKLSVLMKSDLGLISSPYSQGLIDNFPNVQKASEEIAIKIGNAGPLDIQGRLKSGVFYPFEINPRFSGSTYLRALSGFNEVDIFLKILIYGDYKKPIVINPGYCLRSLNELIVSKEDIKK